MTPPKYLPSLLIAIFLCSHLSLCAQFSSNQNREIVIGTVDSLFSEVLEEQREFWVHLPEKMDSAERYPVIYLLDAPAHFYATAGMLKLLTRSDLPESILVGIPNTDRNRDFTPTKVAFQRGRKSATSGGAADFMRFLEKELKPHINREYPTDNLSTIIGHSTGGLFVLYVYTHHPDVFDNYLAIDPSLWWDKESLVKESKALINQGKHEDKQLYVAVANSTGIDTTRVRKSKTEATEILRANLHFHDILVENSSQLNFDWDYYGNEDHGTIVVPGLYNGLRSIFSWYPFPERWRFNNPKRYTAEQLTAPFYAHFTNLSKRFKREVKPDWQFVNDVGFFILNGHKSPKKALAYLKMNERFYPAESRTYVALGDFHASQKEKSDAIKYYQKAIEIDGNIDAQKKLDQLQKDK